MKKTLIAAILVLIAPLTSTAQQEDYKWEADLHAGIYIENEQAWILEPSISWHFHKYLGVSFGWEFTSQYNQPSRSTTINGQLADLTDNEKDIAWMLFKPALILKSPTINLNKDGDYKLWFQAEPGISLACPFKNSLTYEIKEVKGSVGKTVDYMRFPNKDLQWFYWNARLSANVSRDRFVVGLGYEISNFDYYSSRRNVTLQNGEKYWVPKKELSQSVYVTLGYKF
jgi:hypothetical protein